MKNFVNHKWLEENLYNNKIIILDVRGDLSNPNVGQELYDAGHIPNAQYVSMEDILTGDLGEHGGRHPLPDMEKFLEDMKNLGVSDDSTVVIYDDGSISFAGRLWWMLKYIGKEEVYVLAGGYEDWIRRGGETTESSPYIEKSDNLSLKLNEDMRVDMEYVKNSIEQDSIALVDSRSPERYRGEVEPLDKKPGRIPSAINYPFDDLIKGEFPTLREIEDHYKDLDNYEELILYCGSGISATVNSIFMEEVGLTPKLYPGSYSDWISYDENSVEIEKEDK